MKRIALSAAAVAALISGSAWAIAAEDLAGSWNVTLKADYSTCKDVQPGDVKAMQWVFNMTRSGEITATTVGSDITDAYNGRARGEKMMLRADGTGHLATLELKVSGSTMAGRRVVANALSTGPCAIIYEVTGKKL